MSKKVYVGNLNYGTTEETLRNLFAPYGDIFSAVIIKDRDTEQSKGFGFVEFADDVAAEQAIAGLNGREVDGRRVRVNMAEERRDRGGRDFGGRGGYGYRDHDGRGDYGSRGGRYGDRGGYGERGGYDRGGRDFGGYDGGRGGYGGQPYEAGGSY